MHISLQPDAVQTFGNSNYEILISNISLSLNYLRLTPSGGKDIWILKFEFENFIPLKQFKNISFFQIILSLFDIL